MARADFGFVVHPLTHAQRRILGLRLADGDLIRDRVRDPRPRDIAHLSLAIPGRAAPLRGVLVGVPQTTEELLADQAAGVEAVTAAVARCGEVHGARFVGLGAVAAVIGGQGKAVARALPELAITTGNAVTALAAAETAVQLQEGRPDRSAPLGLLGPPGPVANALLDLLTGRGLSLQVVSPKPPGPLARRAAEINASGYGRVEFVASADDVLRGGHPLIAASSTGGRLHRSRLPPGVIVDVAAPQDVVLDGAARSDLLLLDGEYVRLPVPLGGSPWQRLYRWITHQGRSVFGCFAEPMILALADRPDLATVGRTVPGETLQGVGQLMDRWGFTVRGLYAQGRPFIPSRSQLGASAAGDRRLPST